MRASIPVRILTTMAVYHQQITVVIVIEIIDRDRDRDREGEKKRNLESNTMECDYSVVIKLLTAININNLTRLRQVINRIDGQ